MDPLTIAGLVSGGAGLLGGLFGGSSKKTQQPQIIDSRTPEQKAVSAQLAKLLQQGAAPYDGARVAGLTENEQYNQDYMRNALQTAQPGINRLLSGEFPEEYFNQAIADPTRRQFNERVAPVIRENSELTGNRFADRSAIELGQARGDVESGILQQRGQIGLETLRDPINTASALSGVLNNAQNLFQVPRSIQQAQLDANFNEFLRTNPNSGGLIDAMLSFTSQNPLSAFMPQQQQSIFPSLVQAGGSLIGAGMTSQALKSMAPAGVR